ncbi:MAG: ABC transporter permease [Tenuifilaceae bacterium]|jgi:lipopolysaccharide transport system permease protein|nr:ABC transporter permease [Tenuifilaceae bacterium]
MAHMHNPHANAPTSPWAFIQSIAQHHRLILQMSWREIASRYKGSLLGLTWSFINPLLMLAVYTFVFSVVFKARWGIGTDESRTQFAVVLFAGLIVHGLFAEVLNRAPAIILGNVNFVKKVVFPLEILPVVSLMTALFQAVISLCVLMVAFILFNGYLHWTIILTPLVLFPLVLLTIGFAWILASIGVFLRDIGQLITILTTILLFLAPVFYPITALPERFQMWLMINPLTFIIEQAREVIIWGNLPNWSGLGIYTAAASLVAWLGFIWFQKTRKGFADVL